MSKIDVIKDIESLPIKSITLDNDGEILASKNSDLSEASGKYILVKKAIKEYVDANIKVDREVLNNYTYSISDIVYSRPEFIDNYQTSYKPNFIEIDYDNIIVRISEFGLDVFNQKKVKDIAQEDIILDKNKILSILSELSVDYEGCVINDTECDGSEKTKFFDNIKIKNISQDIEQVRDKYEYYLTDNNEIIYGRYDSGTKRIIDITRGKCVSNNFSILPLKPLVNETKIYLLNSIRVYYNIRDKNIEFVPTKAVIYKPSLNGVTSGYKNDCFYSTRDEVWYVYDGSSWASKVYNVYLGDLIYRGNNLLGVYNSDIKCILDNVSNIDINISNNRATTNSDYTVVSVFNKMVEFELDRLNWDLTGYTNEVYLYIDGDGKTWVDTLEPKYNNILEYYVHYYHYWRCVGHLKYEDNSWVVKEI